MRTLQTSTVNFHILLSEVKVSVAQLCPTERARLLGPWDPPGTSAGVGCHCLLRQCRRPRVYSCVRKILWRRDRLPTPVLLGFLVAQLVKNPTAMWETWVRSLGPDLQGRSPGERKGYLLQHSNLEKSMDSI